MTDYAIGADGRLTTAGAPPAEAPPADLVSVVRSFLSPEEIAAIFSEVHKYEFAPAKLAGGENGVVKEEVRKSMVVWLPASSMAGLQVAGAVKAVASAPVTHWDTVQVACYQPGMFFEWHEDAGEGLGTHNYRRWTAVAELQSAPGGGLELEGAAPLELAPGDLVIFPASLSHRATPPLSGIRFSLTCWFW